MEQKPALKLIEKYHQAGNAWTFRFEPSHPLHWQAGQFIGVELPHKNPDARGTQRWFTVASAPYEAVVQITTRISQSSFKQALNALPIGGELILTDLPSGEFIWQDSDLPKLFVAGGIGITAIHSILKQRVHDDLPIDLRLIFGNRDDQIPFKDELDQWVATHKKFTIDYVTGMPLTAESLRELEPGLHNYFVYISGPEPMVVALADELLESGLPKLQLKIDKLENYTIKNY